MLVVDDDLDLLEILKASLESENRHVFVASSAVDALKSYLTPDALKRNPIDVVLSDMKMPEMSGLEFLIATRNRSPHATFLILTGYAEKFKMFLAMRYGAYDFVEKPYQLAALDALISEGVRVGEREAYLERSLPERLLQAGFPPAHLLRLKRKIQRVARLSRHPSTDEFVDQLLGSRGSESQLQDTLMNELKRSAQWQIEEFRDSSDLLSQREDPKVLPLLRRIFHSLANLKKASFSVGLEDLGQSLQIQESIVLYLRGFPQLMTNKVAIAVQASLSQAMDQFTAIGGDPEGLTRLCLASAAESQLLLDELEDQVVGLL